MIGSLNQKKWSFFETPFLINYNILKLGLRIYKIVFYGIFY